MAETQIAPTSAEEPASEKSKRGILLPKRLRSRINAESAIVLFSIPIIVVLGFLAYVVYHATANLDVVEESALAWPTIWQQIGEHIKITFVSAFFVIIIAVPLGVLLTRGRAKVAAPLVVGFANASAADAGNTNFRAFHWRKGESTRPLPALPGHVTSSAAGVNDRRQIVGQSCSA